MAKKKHVDGPYGGPKDGKSVPGHVLAAILIIIAVVALLVVRFILFFDWDTKTGRLLTDLGHIEGPERPIEDGINEWLFGLYGWDGTDEDQRAQSVRPEDSGIAGDGKYVPADPDEWDELTE